MVSQLQGLSSGSLYQLKTLNNKLLGEIGKISTGKNINQASDDPSGYYTSKLLEQDLLLSETESKKIEREKNFSSTKSSRFEEASNIISEIASLGKDASLSQISNQEKDIIQNQIKSLLNNLKDTMENGNLGSLENFGIDINEIVVNGSDSELEHAITKIENFFTDVLAKNTEEGSNYNSLSRKLDTLAPIITNLKSSLSSLNDADLANESIILNQQKIMKHLAMQGIKQSGDIAKSTLDLFG